MYQTQHNYHTHSMDGQNDENTINTKRKMERKMDICTIVHFQRWANNSICTLIFISQFVQSFLSLYNHFSVCTIIYQPYLRYMYSIIYQTQAHCVYIYQHQYTKQLSKLAYLRTKQRLEVNAKGLFLLLYTVALKTLSFSPLKLFL